MRLKFVAAAIACLSLAACGGSDSGQANNSQGNISNDSRTADTANASAIPASNKMAMIAVPKEQLLTTMHDRHEGMEAIGKANKAISRQLKDASPDLAVVRQSAAQIAKLSRQASGWFPQGSGPELGKTGAKPEIWQNQKDFAAKLHNFQTAASAFNAAAAGSDVNATKARFADLEGTCKACHDKYRSEMHH
jgi:cytochrome c556